MALKIRLEILGPFVEFVVDPQAAQQAPVQTAPPVVQTPPAKAPPVRSQKNPLVPPQPEARNANPLKDWKHYIGRADEPFDWRAHQDRWN
jgi:hypothetical protein